MKWNSVKYFLSVLLLLVASLSTSLLTTSTANAVSDYDNVFTVSPFDKLRLSIEGGNFGEYSEFTEAEFKTYLESRKSTLFWRYPVLVDWYLAGNPTVVQQVYDQLSHSYGVTMYVGGEPETPVSVDWTTSAALVNLPSSNSNFGYYSTNCQSATLTIYLDGQGSASCYTGTTQHSLYNVFDTSLIDPNYPSGYEGDLIPGATQVIPDELKLRPNIVFDVMNKNISINSKVNQIVKQQVSDYKVYWFITNATFDGDGSSCETPFTTSGYSLPNEPLSFEVPCLGVYSVNAYFAYSNGDFPIDDFGDYRIFETTINVDVNGGYFSIDTDNDFICDENNFCQHPSELWEDEPCDLLNLGGCVNNILHYLQVAMGIDKTATNPTGSPFVSFRTETHGLLAIVTAPLTAINALTTTSCSPVSFTIPYVNKNITLPCYYSIYQSNLGSLFTLYQTLATGVIAYYVIVGILRQVKEIKDPKKDQIEVVNL